MENRTKILFAIQKIIPAWMLDLFGYNASTMDFIINLGIPHVSEHIFRTIDTATLIRFRQVSKVWKIIIENRENIDKRHSVSEVLVHEAI